MSGIEKIQFNKGESNSRGELITIVNQPVMECALDVLTELVKHKTITMEARGESIPTAVAVANVLTENMLKGNSKILDIIVDSEHSGSRYGPLISIIKITISKLN